MLGHGPVVTIRMEETALVLDAVSADQKINCLTNGNTAATQGPIVGSRFLRDQLTDHSDYVKLAQRSLHLIDVSLAVASLQ